MYSRILVPIDLGDTPSLTSAIDAAALIARATEGELVFCAVSSHSPDHVRGRVQEARHLLEAFAARQAGRLGLPIRTHVEISTDPAAELDDRLERAAETLRADLIVMASHKPGWREYVFSSHAGWLAQHSHLSVFVVR